MHLLIPLFSLASLAAALPSSSPSPRPIWSRVATSSATPSSSPSSSPVWSRVDTSTPSSTSPLVWSKVETSTPSTTSTSSSSPLVWSRVDTVKPTTTSTPQWTRVTRSRPASSSSSSSSSSPPSSISTTTTSSLISSPTSVCPTGVPANSTKLPGCYQGQPLDWISIATYLNYREAGAGPLNNTKLTNGTGYYSGSPLDCPHAEEVVQSSNVHTLRIAVSDELAAQFGGIENLCGKKLVINEPLRPKKTLNFPSDWFTPPPLVPFEYTLATLFTKMFGGFPDTIHKVRSNMIAWVDWKSPGGPFKYGWY
ncbi:hypothetical protein JCM5350_000118 [Sporobolomyces pararoseus]